jgi:hypothetical protein
VGVHPTPAGFNVLCNLLRGEYLFACVNCDCGVWLDVLDSVFHVENLLIVPCLLRTACGSDFCPLRPIVPLPTAGEHTRLIREIRHAYPELTAETDEL